jgi:hypothetical protein
MGGGLATRRGWRSPSTTSTRNLQHLRVHQAVAQPDDHDRVDAVASFSRSQGRSCRASLTSLARSRTSSRSPRTAGGAIQLEGTGCPCPPPRPALSGRQRRANRVLENFVEPRLRGRTLDIHPFVVLVVTAFGPPPRRHRRPQLGRARLGDRRQRHHPPALKRRPRSGGRTWPARRASPARLTRRQPNPILGGSS